MSNPDVNLFTTWQLQESLLQQYRNIFTVLEAFLLAAFAGLIATEVALKNQPVILFSALIIALLGVYFIFAFHKITTIRAAMVTWCQEQLRHGTQGINIIEGLQQTARDAETSYKIPLLPAPNPIGVTRNFFQRQIPLFYFITWCFMISILTIKSLPLFTG